MPGGGVGDVEEVEAAVDGGDDAAQGDGTTPVENCAGGQFKSAGEGQEASDGHHGEGREGRAEVAPASIDAFSKADLLGREPLSHHADADHEARTNDGEQQTSHHKGIEILG